VDHVCGQAFTAAGTVLALQAPRDCREVQCDGSGGVTSAVDDTDLPDDNNDCTGDVCNAGTPAHPLSANGDACGDGTLTCDGAGQCVGCTLPSQCGAETFCATNTCAASVCGRAFTAAGTVAPMNLQDPGDCQSQICDGDGGLAPIAEDTDTPQDDGDECTLQTCVDGAPMFPPALIDTPCASGGSFCDGAGACVGCNAGSQCGTDTACVQFACVTNACAVLVAQPGTPIPSESQVAGDCQLLSCGNSGGVQSAMDDTDLPVDGNDCTSDVCTTGAPSNPPINAGGACGDGTQMCDDMGRCLSCFDASDCEGGTFCSPMACVAGACVAAPLAPGTPVEDVDQVDGDCQRSQCDGAGAVEIVIDNSDLPGDTSNECIAPACNEGVPGSFPLPTGNGCTVGGNVCDGSGTCVACNADAECGTSTDCQLHRCVNHMCEVQNVMAGTVTTEQTAGDCREVRCNGTGGTTSATANTDTPNDQNACTADTCSSGNPVFTPTPNASCGTSGICNAGGQCVGCNAASDCGTNSFCRSYSCVANTCQVNNTAANTALPAGSQVPADCRTLVCDGAGGTLPTPDPVDVPNDDGNECTVGACMGSTPVQNPNPLGVPCNGGADLCNGSGACVECLAASDCGFDSFCATFACVNNTCQQTNTAVGTDLPAGSQAPLDCRVLECDGTGNERSVALNTDLPVDGNACTSDVCSAGTPSNPPTPVNSVCNADGGTFCDGGGQCVQCNVATQCGTNTFCQTFTCNSGECGTAPTGVGVPLPGQTAGDCQEQQCNGMGGTRSVANDVDLPNDANQCTDDVCSLGVPSNPNRLVNSGCSEDGGTFCNGTGSCVECNAGSQCGTNTFCAQFVCSAGECGVTNTTVGTDLPAGSQSGGDCQVIECNGLGATRSVALNTDVPVDGNECTADTCTAGVPSNPNRALNFGCGTGDFCNGSGACVDCTAAAQCGTNTFCQTFTCSSNSCGTSNTTVGTDLPGGSQMSGDCQVLECNGMGATRSVALNSDLPVDGNECTDDLCSSGAPSNPASPPLASCTMGGDICDGAGDCVECITAADCGTSTFCQAFACNAGVCQTTNTAAGTDLPAGSQSSGDCRVQECNGSGAVVNSVFNTDLPVDGNACTNDVCSAGTPSNPNRPADFACGSGDFCNGSGACVDCNNATQCGTATFCQSFTCNSNTCGTVNTAMGTDLPPGSQTTGDCRVQECNGAGVAVSTAFNTDLPVDGNACTSDVCTAGTPSNPPTAINTACGSGDFCNGSGACVDCTAASQCGTSTFCQTFTCNSNTCGTSNTANGTDLPPGSQTTGDCRVQECNGAGVAVNAVFNTDVPVDGNPCTNDVCSAGTPSNPNQALNFACGSGDFCNGTGTCVDCNNAAQCGTDSFCRAYTCTSNACGSNNTAVGTDLPGGSQTSGDCQVNECDGLGAVRSVALNSDIPVDSSQCTNDVCTAGVPSHPPVAAGAMCSMGGNYCNGSGSCVQCLAAADCGTSTFCQVFSCNTGVCQTTNTTAGIDLPGGSQTAADCQVLECNGMGAVRSVALNSDLPSDGNSCTSDTCSAGTPTFTDVPNGTMCGSAGMCQGGDCVGCMVAADCGVSNFCVTYTCNANSCGVAYTPNGTALPGGSQTGGNCQTLVCDGAGATISIAANGDVPVDGNQCTSDICTAGAPSNPPAAINTACGSGDFCNGAGSCVDCTSASQCGTSTFCQTFTCNSNTCGTSNTPNGTDLPPGSQTAGNCQVLECNGAGSTVSTAFNTDLPVDGNACTSDVCTAGTPSNPPTAANTACGSGDFCNGSGACVDCTMASQCGTSTFCQTFTCNSNTCGTSNTANGTDLPMGSQTAGNCQVLECNGAGSTISTAFNSDVPVDGNACTSDVCTSGVPSNPAAPANTACGSGDFCNGSGSCVDCTSAAQCGTDTFCQTFTCNSNTCGTINTAVGTDLPGGNQTAGDCRLQECNGSGGTMNSVADSDLPVDGLQCTNDVCTAGTPSNPPLAANTACGSGDFCNGSGACVDCTMASQCGTSTFCQTFTCNSNTCGTSNTANGTDLPMGSQTTGNCQVLECNGAGSTISTPFNTDLPVDGNTCTSDVCTAGVPSNPAAPINTACGSGDFCNGAGSCVDCTAASQCGTSTFCQTFTCNSNTCGTSNTANGTDLPMGSQATGDCQVLECNGAGSTISTAFNTDLPVDGLQCTNDVCTGGVPSNPPLAANTACGAGDFCNGAGACVDCTMASQCGVTTTCRTYTCNSNTCGFTNAAIGTDLPPGNQTTGDCKLWECNGSGSPVQNTFNTDLPVDGNACTGDICTAGTPTNPNLAINTACGSGDFCNGSGSCVDCTTSTQCPTGNQCQGRSCTGNVCGLTSLANGTSCNDGQFCTNTDTCNGAGSCTGSVTTPCNTLCQTCNEGMNTCNNVANFTLCNDGQFCTTSSWCSGGTCVGVGGSPCDSQCQSCSEFFNQCNDDPLGTACSTPASGRNNVCFVEQCSAGACGRRINRFDNGVLPLDTTYSYANITSFGTCTACHSSHTPPGNFSFSELWSETVSDSVFDSECVDWNTDPDRTFYGNFRAGCVLYVLDQGIMPPGDPGGWLYDDEYLDWFCSNSGPGGGVNNW
jgi:hypothetical protein